MAVIAEPTFVGAVDGGADSATSTGSLSVPGRGTANFWLAVCGTNQSFSTQAGWTTVRNGGTYGKLYVAYTRSDPGATISFGGSNTGSYSCLLTAWLNVADPPFYYESLYDSTAYQTLHSHPGVTPTGDSGYVGAIGVMQEWYSRTNSSHGFLNMTLWGTNVKNVTPATGAKFSTQYAVKGALDSARNHLYRSSWSSSTRGVLWMGFLQYGLVGPSFKRDGVAGADIGTVSGVQASDIGKCDGVSALLPAPSIIPVERPLILPSRFKEAA